MKRFKCFVLGKRRNEYGKQVRNDYEKHKISVRRCEMLDLVLVRETHSNTITTVTTDNLICVIWK